jgi:hypothetical protein
MFVTTRRIAVALAAAIVLPAVASAQAQLPADSLERARTVALFVLKGEADSLIARMTPAILEQFGGKEGLVAGLTTLGTRAGDETSVVEERWNMRNGQRQYWRTSKMSLFPGDFLIRINLDAAGNISGIGMGPAANAPPVESVGPVIPKP